MCCKFLFSHMYSVLRVCLCDCPVLLLDSNFFVMCDIFSFTSREEQHISTFLVCFSFLGFLLESSISVGCVCQVWQGQALRTLLRRLMADSTETLLLLLAGQTPEVSFLAPMHNGRIVVVGCVVFDEALTSRRPNEKHVGLRSFWN